MNRCQSCLRCLTGLDLCAIDICDALPVQNAEIGQVLQGGLQTPPRRDFRA